MTIYGKGCISNYRNCSLSYVWYSVLYRMLTIKYYSVEKNGKSFYLASEIQSFLLQRGKNVVNNK